MQTPHYLRVARALALVSGLAGAAGCYASHETGDTSLPDASLADAGRRDAGRRDAGPRDAGPRDAGPRDGGDPCTTCGCYSVFGNDGGPGGPPECFEVGLDFCCPVVGPLSPPDLPA
jgi:hypothetical protein